MEENVLVLPNCLHFQVGGSEKTKDTIIISSAWSHHVAFKVTSSVPHLFDIFESEGFIPPCQSTRVAVTFIGGSANDVIPRFDVFLQQASSKDSNARIFWSQNSPSVTKKVSCDMQGVVKHGSDHMSSRSECSSGILPPVGRLLDLMVKNVSKSDPLTRQEAEELKSERSTMTREQWESWLHYARAEKKRRNQTASSTAVTPNPSARTVELATLSKSSEAVERAFEAFNRKSSHDIEHTLDRAWETCVNDATTSTQRDKLSQLESKLSSRPSSPATYEKKNSGHNERGMNSHTADATPQATRPELSLRATSPMSVMTQNRTGEPDRQRPMVNTRPSSPPHTSRPNSRPSSPGQQPLSNYHRTSLSRASSPTQHAPNTGSHSTSLSRSPSPSSNLLSAPGDMQHVSAQLGRKSTPYRSSSPMSQGVSSGNMGGLGASSHAGPGSRSSHFRHSPEHRPQSRGRLPPSNSSDPFPRSLEEVSQIRFHPAPDRRAVDVPRKPNPVPQLHDTALGGANMPTRSAMRPTSTGDNKPKENSTVTPLPRTQFHPYQPTSDADPAIGASPPHYPKRPNDYQNLTWQHKIIQNEDPARTASPPRSTQPGSAVVGSSPPHNPRHPPDERDSIRRRSDHDDIGRSLFASDTSAPSNIRPPAGPSSTQGLINEGTFHVNADGSMSVVMSGVTGSAIGMINSSPATPLHQFNSSFGTSTRERSVDRSDVVSDNHVASTYRHSSSPIPGYRTVEKASYPHIPLVNVPLAQQQQQVSAAAVRHQYQVQKEKEVHQLKEHLSKQDRVRQEQAKQWEREEDDWVVQRQIEKQRETTNPQHPHTEAGAIVKASTLRIDSAYAAAQCLKASLEADMSDPHAAERTSAALGMVNAMIAALEKSKTSLSELSAEEDHLQIHKKSQSADAARSSPTCTTEVANRTESKPETLGAHVDDCEYHEWGDVPSSETSSQMAGEDEFDRYTSVVSHNKSKDDRGREVASGNISYTPTSYKHSARGTGRSSARRRMSSSELNDLCDGSVRASKMKAYNSASSTALTSTGQTHSPAFYRERFDSPPPLAVTETGMTLMESDSELDLSDPVTVDHRPHYFMLSRHEDRALKKSSNIGVTKQTVHSVRKAKGLPRVMRICVSPGAMIKAYEENPLRVDVENCKLDIVWRERHVAGETFRFSRGDAGVGSRASTLRRERYSFDEVFSGPQAVASMCSYAKKRVKSSLLNGRGVGYLSLAGGEYGGCGASYLEPPMAMLLGDCGGQGIMSAVAEEIFNCKRSTAYPSVQKTPNRRNHSSPTHPVELANVVLFTAVIVCGGVVVDLLGVPKRSQSGSRQTPRRCQVSRRSNGSYYITNVTRLQLKSSADYERVAGVLLGRRAALREMGPSMADIEMSSSGGNLSMPETPWLLSSEHEACALFSMTTLGEGVSMSSHKEVSFHFVSPCGIHWGLPGTEVCLLAEAISGLPHDPPPSLLKEGNITQLLVDPHGPELDYVTIASVGKQSRDGRRPSLEEDEEMIQNALQSFRVVSQLSALPFGS